MRVILQLIATGWGILSILSTFKVMQPFSEQLITTLVCILIMMMVLQQDINTKE
jgi:hypothetical protein